MLGQPGSEQYRIRLGLLFGSLGVLMILSAWGMWAVRESDAVKALAIARSAPVASPTSMTEVDQEQRLQAARALPMLLLFIFFVVLTILVGSFVIVRAIRRHRVAMEHQRPPPTDSSDVWSRHRVPDYDDEDDYDPS
jgi:hypothetical protein